MFSPVLLAAIRSLPGAADGFDRIVDRFRMPVDDLFHVAVLLLDLHAVAGARIVLHHVTDDPLQQRLFLLQPRDGEVAHDEADRGLLQRAGLGVVDAWFVAMAVRSLRTQDPAGPRPG